MIYLQLFYEFFKIGLFAIGGGLSTLPFLYALADKYTWFSREMLVNMIAISESTPGPIGINMATYAGYSAGGILGGVVATFALVTPAFFIMLAVVKVLTAFSQSKYVQNAFYGLRPAVTALIASAGIGLLSATLLNLSSFPELLVFDFKQLALYAALLFASLKFKRLQAVHLIAAAAVVGIVFKF